MSHYCYDTNTFIISPHTGVEILLIFNKNNEKGEHFENVFGLGSNCLNWSPNTIIGIINNKSPPRDLSSFHFYLKRK